MDKRIISLAAGIPLIASIGMGCQENKEQPLPNIIFIFADDQGPLDFGVMNPEVHTPHLDQLAKNGTLFTQAYNQGSFTPAVCVASRAMLITGTYLWKAAEYSDSGRNRNGNTPAEMPEYSVPRTEPSWYWPLEMKAAGYDTYFTGKWHINVPADELFDHVGTVRGGMPSQSEERYNRRFIEGEPDTWHPWDSIFGGYWEGGTHWSEVIYDETSDFLQLSSESKNPFFMYIAFNAPHDPRQSPKEFVDMYPVDEILVPPNFLPIYPYAEEIGSGQRLRDERLAPFPRTEYAVRRNRQEFYAIISHMDYQIGRIMEELKRTGQDKNTYIIFTADHGLAVGDHGFMGKQNMYDASMKVPLIISGPEVKKNRRNDQLVYFQDIVPTTLEIAGIPKPQYVDYHSFLPLASGKEDKSTYDAVYGAYMGTQRMIRNEKYKMLIYPVANVVRLYDMENDPFEIHDLASDLKYKPVMDELFIEFKKLQTEVSDPLDITPYYQNFFFELSSKSE